MSFINHFICSCLLYSSALGAFDYFNYLSDALIAFAALGAFDYFNYLSDVLIAFVYAFNS